MNNNELKALREQILNDVMPLVLESASQGSDRFSILLRIIQAGNATSEVYKQAYSSAKLIEDTDEKLSALLSLLDEIDLESAGAESQVVTPDSHDSVEQETQQ